MIVNYAMLPPVYDRSPSLEIRGLEPRSGASTQLVHGTNAHHASILQTVDNVWCIHQPLSSLVGQHLQIEQLHKMHQSMCDLHPSTMYSSPSSRIWQACWPQICILWSQRQLNASDGAWQDMASRPFCICSSHPGPTHVWRTAKLIVKICHNISQL